MGANSQRSKEADRSGNRLVDEVLDAYDEWFDECIQVRDSYARWSEASRADAAGAFAAYESELDREERAADRLRELVGRLEGNAAGLLPRTRSGSSRR
jgi:hypothetical protein